MIGSWELPVQPRSSFEQVEIAGIAKGPVAFPKKSRPGHRQLYLDGSDLGVHEPQRSQQVALHSRGRAAPPFRWLPDFPLCFAGEKRNEKIGKPDHDLR